MNKRETCIAPKGDGPELCGKHATEERLAEGLICPLCAEHAAEIDQEEDVAILFCPDNRRARLDVSG